MTYNPDIHHRRSIRLQGYDYSSAGAYFITMCTQNRECLFGNIIVGATPCGCPISPPRACPEMVLNQAGAMVQTVWDEIPIHYTRTEIDEFVVMPNHIHGIIVIGAVGATPCGCPDPGTGASGQNNGQARGPGNNGQARGPAPTGKTGILSLGDIVHRFKTMTTKRYADGVKQLWWQSFAGKLWQRNYWEHIIRNEMELNRIREYIHDNPSQWESDRLNLHNDRSAYPSMVRECVVTYATEGWMV
jgi:putative transposase